MIVYEEKSRKSSYWELQLKAEITQQVSIANCPMFGSNDLHAVVTGVNNWMQNRKRDTTGSISMFYKLVIQGNEVVVNHLNVHGDVKRVVAVIKKIN